ncbi:GGDEF domain-containing protein [Parasphingorhabdus cellanae]|uniref:diguanylate cyclase n=1 Tax=Parasphingorhabdus cellanae TaxID=2806553 RepID=A0ABX7T399_9SPHN|nr:diguanylate cyclase [Parasphingorhabdus cellanae]QTD55428.1 diguanylate cyclase [Parasphingorhabdus cellanae]
MKIDIKNILDSYFRENGNDETCPVCTEEDGQRSPLYAIAGFIRQHGLLLSSRNLELAWAFICGGNSMLKSEIMGLSSAGRLDNASASELFDKYLSPDVGAQIDKIVLEAIEHIRTTTKIIEDGNKKTTECEENLMEQADNIRAKPADIDAAIKKLLSLSKLMVESTRENRERISETNKKLATLQNELEQARNEADFDQLTKLPNRRKFDRTLDEKLKKLAEEKLQLVLVFIDIDHFKKVNDTFGHECGDRVLRMFADELASLSDSHCHTSRYGGEEFAVIFEGQTINNVWKMIDQCRQSLAGRSLVDLQSGRPLGSLTFSAGIAKCLPSDTKRSLLRKADLALYEAKSQGRNTVLKYSNDR